MIYIGHKNSTEIADLLFSAIQQSELYSKDICYIPGKQKQHIYSKELIKGAKLFIAEVSENAMGLGIELGWADSFGIPIIYLLRQDKKLKYSLTLLEHKVYTYNTEQDLINIFNVIAANTKLN